MFKEPLNGLGVDECLAEVGDGLPVGHRSAGREAEEGAKAVAVGDLKAGGIIGQPVQPLEHEHLEHEQRMKARPASRSFGLGGHGGVDDGLEELPVDEFAHPHQRGLEGRHIQAAHELIEEPRFAEGNEVCHAPH